MARKLYDREIYHRENQIGRKVYQRTNNVLPTEPIPPVPPVTEDTYQITAAVVKAEGTGYQDSFTNNIASDKTPGVLTITASEGKITAVAITTPGIFANDESGDFDVIDENGEGTGGKVTLTFTKIEA